MRFLALDKLINLHDGYRRAVKIDQVDVLLLQEAGQLYIIQSRCPHQEQSLVQAEVEAGVLYCPRHQYGFSLQTGAHIDGMCESLTTWTPVFEGNEVGILVAST